VTELIALAYKYENVYLEASIYEFLPGAEPIFEAANTILQDKVIYASGFPFRPLADLQRFLEYPFAPEVVQKLVYGNAARVLGIE
jgi:predicted TIM-barrel fold metal-dependent hydrolase